MGIYGQDWASYQPSQPDTTGLSFAIVKITEGLGYINPKWRQQRDHAKAAGLVWGGYHYPHMANSPKAEADYFLSQVNWQPGDIVVLDWEGYDNANAGVSKARQLAYKEEWLRYVKTRMPNNPIGMYCNADYWKNVDTTGYTGDFLWIATAGRAAGDPGIKANWLFHQYKASPVDTDYCHLDSLNALRAWALSFASPSEEDDMPTAAEIANAVWTWTETPGNGKPVRAGAAITWMDSVHAGQNTKLADILTKVSTPQDVALTDAQASAIADRLAASPTLAEKIAELVASKLADRLQS